MALDYAFSPGITTYDGYGRILWTLRPNTKLIHFDLIHIRFIHDVEAFIQQLMNDPFVFKPVGNLIINTHGREGGYMKIDLDQKTKDRSGKDYEHTYYTVVKKAVDNHSVEIPEVLHHSPPNPPVEFDVHIRGCNIGKSPAFVRKLKEAFKTPRTVTAPKHAHHLLPFGIGKDDGFYEYLEYAFDVLRPEAKQFRNGQEAAEAFDQGWQFYDNKTVGRFTFIKDELGVEEVVSKDLWDKLMPDLNGRSLGDNFKLGVNLGENIHQNITEVNLFREFENKKEEWGMTMTDIDQDPGNKDQREVMFREAIKNDDDFKLTSDNLFPIYMQAGYKKVDDFLDGYTWDPTWDPKTKIITVNGVRRKYTVYLPVVNPRNKELFFNFYPVDGSGLKRHEGLWPPDFTQYPYDELFLTV